MSLHSFESLFADHPLVHPSSPGTGTRGPQRQHRDVHLASAAGAELVPFVTPESDLKHPSSNEEMPEMLIFPMVLSYNQWVWSPEKTDTKLSWLTSKLLVSLQLFHEIPSFRSSCPRSFQTISESPASSFLPDVVDGGATRTCADVFWCQKAPVLRFRTPPLSAATHLVVLSSITESNLFAKAVGRTGPSGRSEKSHGHHRRYCSAPVTTCWGLGAQMARATASWGFQFTQDGKLSTQLT